MRGKGEEHYNDNAANYFILFVLAIITLPSTFVFLKRRLVSSHDPSPRCECRDCKMRVSSAKAKEGKMPSVGTVFKAVLLVILWCLMVYVLVNSGKAESPAADYFDPYPILGLEPGASIEVIKATYKKLSKIYHPDKAENPNDPDVQTRYINLAKAYETLTDDAVREKWEKYGNPDGPQAMSVGIALPSWLVKKDNTFVVLGVYMALLVIGLPAVVGCWWRSWKKYDTSSKVMNSTMGLYYHNIEPTARVKNLIEVVSASEEFSHIPMRDSDAQLDKFIKRIPENHAPKKTPKFNAKYAIKTHLLLYVQLCRQQEELKKSQKADLAFVLSKVRPLIGGAITICTARTYFGPILETIQLLQSLTQSCWKEQSLLQLPHFNEYSVSNASARKFNATDVISFSNLAPEKKKEFYEKEEFKPEQVLDIENVLNFLPTKVSFEYTVAVEGEDTDTIVCGSLVTFYYTIRRTPANPENYNKVEHVKRPIETDTPASVKKRAALDASRPKRVIHAPNFMGDQRDECWWIVIGDLRTSGTTGGLAGINKVGSLEGDVPVEGKIKFIAPQTEGSYTFVVHLLCDGYLGFDKKSEFRVKVVRDVAGDRERAAQEEKLKQKKKRIADKKAGKVVEDIEGESDSDSDMDDEDSMDDDEDDDGAE